MELEESGAISVDEEQSEAADDKCGAVEIALTVAETQKDLRYKKLENCDIHYRCSCDCRIHSSPEATGD